MVHTDFQRLRAFTLRKAWQLLLVLLPSAVCAQDIAGTLKSVRGEATLERAGARRPARLGEALYEKDRLLTGSDGHAGVALQDQSVLAIGPRSDIALSRYKFSATTHQGQQQVQMRSGTLAAISGKLAKANPETVQFNAGSVTLGVRGTQFLMDIRPQADASAVSHWTDTGGQAIRSQSGQCWQTSHSGTDSGSECNPDRFVLLPDREGQVGRIVLQTPAQSVILQTAYAGAEASARQLQSVALSGDDVRQRYRALLDTLPPAPRLFVVRFLSGSATELSPESLAVLEEVRTAIAQWPVVADVSVVGHTDTVGELHRNDALSLERARSVSQLLQANGINPDHLHTSGRGERQPVVATPDETPEPQNRRVEITVY